MSAIDIRRKNSLNLFREQSKYSNYSEFPVLKPEVDPQLCVSRNEVDQPFYLICEKDTVLAALSGRARVRFLEGPVNYFSLEQGDYVYVPAGYAHRIECAEASLHLRYKARDPGREAAVFHCTKCRSELHRITWSNAEQPAQAGYAAAVASFNERVEHRTCSCGEVHPPIDGTAFQWTEIAESLRPKGEAPPA